MNTSHKGFATLTIVALIAVLLIGGVYVYKQSNQSTKPQTSSLETYRNEKYGYQFEYPSEWKLREYLTLDTDPRVLTQANAISVLSNGDELAFYAEMRDKKTELGVAIVCATPTTSNTKTLTGQTVPVTEQQACILGEMRDVYGTGNTLEVDIPIGQRYLYLRMDTSEKPKNHRQEFLELVKSLRI